ncbi:hypothetical protein DL96DRAFT_1704007 [Flagelloscypha sp. PMI_526]|nr:hypothetical protein DL96DRAFT_1704007 [Flagelloscypha sp. PMI_526]
MSSTTTPHLISVDAIVKHVSLVKKVIGDQDLSDLRAREICIIEFYSAFLLSQAKNTPFAMTDEVTDEMRKVVTDVLKAYRLLERNGLHFTGTIPNLASTIVPDLEPVLGVWDFLLAEETTSSLDTSNPFEIPGDGDSVMAVPNNSPNWENVSPSVWATASWCLSSPSDMDYTSTFGTSTPNEMLSLADMNSESSYEGYPVHERFDSMTRFASPELAAFLGFPSGRKLGFSDAIRAWAHTIGGGESNPPRVDLRGLREALYNIKEHPQGVASFSLEPTCACNAPYKNPRFASGFKCQNCKNKGKSCDTLTSPGLSLQYACVTCIGDREVCDFVGDESATVQTESAHFVEAYQYAIDYAEKLFHSWVSNLESLHAHIGDLYLVNYAFSKYKYQLKDNFKQSVNHIEQ